MCARAAGLILLVSILAGCAPGPEPGTQTADVIAVATPGELAWSDLGRLDGEPQGVPLFVSNNPEVVGGYGILAGVPYPGLSLHGAQRAPGAPEAQWTREVVDPRCPNGGLMELGAYLAHILPSSLGPGRRLTLVAVAEQDASIVVKGMMGTTNWSSGGQPLTVEPDWLSAEIAREFFFGAVEERVVEAQAGEMVVLDTLLAESLVEGRFHIESDACLHPFVIAHAAPLGGFLPGHYAPGDVKWPGWANGKGHGRAAGVYRADGWRADGELAVSAVPSVVGVGLLTPEDAMVALARHEDSAEILFGNYGAQLDATLTLTNDSPGCAEVSVELVSYIDRGGLEHRTPTAQLFLDTPDLPIPSIFFNGPLAVGTESTAIPSLQHAVLRHAPTASELAAPHLAMASMRHAFAEVVLAAGHAEQVSVALPIPGYIVAPVAITAHATACAP